MDVDVSHIHYLNGSAQNRPHSIDRLTFKINVDTNITLNQKSDLPRLVLHFRKMRFFSKKRHVMAPLITARSRITAINSNNNDTKMAVAVPQSLGGPTFNSKAIVPRPEKLIIIVAWRIFPAYANTYERGVCIAIRVAAATARPPRNSLEHTSPFQVNQPNTIPRALSTPLSTFSNQGERRIHSAYTRSD